MSRKTAPSIIRIGFSTKEINGKYVETASEIAISLFADVKISENTSKQTVFSDNMPPGYQHQAEKQKKEAEKFAVIE